MIDSVIKVFIFAIGAAVGSFLNVCIVRMPEEKSVIWPSSHCVHCKKNILWFDNIPLLSYWLLRGRCRFCKEKISIRYFLVELLTACFFIVFYNTYGLHPVLIPYLIFVCGLIIATFVDIKYRIIPDEISVGGIVVGFLLSLAIPDLQQTSSVLLAAKRSCLGILIGGGSIYAMGLLGDFIFKKESMGGGDVKLLAMIGAFLGWPSAILAFFIAPLFGAVAGIIVKIRTKESLIPYGPFLALGAIISLFWSQEIIVWVLSGYGLY
ncbi:MAG: prepilin peptidase [Candidatus Omnitrophota bacterium]